MDYLSYHTGSAASARADNARLETVPVTRTILEGWIGELDVARSLLWNPAAVRRSPSCAVRCCQSRTWTRRSQSVEDPTGGNVRLRCPRLSGQRLTSVARTVLGLRRRGRDLLRRVHGQVSEVQDSRLQEGCSDVCEVVQSGWRLHRSPRERRGGGRRQRTTGHALRTLERSAASRAA